MTSSSISSAPATLPRLPVAPLLVVACLAVALFVPTAMSLNQHLWGIVGQGHGPIMVALSAYLAWERWPKLRAVPPKPANVVGALLLLFGGLVYVVGRSQDVLFMDAGAQIPLLAGLVLLIWGWQGLKVMWFPILFLFFVIPIPGSVVDSITAPLKSAVSTVAENLLFAMGYPMGRSGVTLTVGPYRLLVADACAGMNSIFALEAIGVFYISVMGHTHRLRNMLLAMLILPISFLSNVLRVMVLVMVTYHFGDAVGQGFVHDFAGMLLFGVATFATFATDAFLGLFLPRHSPEHQAQLDAQAAMAAGAEPPVSAAEQPAAQAPLARRANS